MKKLIVVAAVSSCLLLSLALLAQEKTGAQIAAEASKTLMDMTGRINDFDQIVKDAGSDAKKRGCVNNQVVVANGALKAATGYMTEINSLVSQNKLVDASNKLQAMATAQTKFTGAITEARKCAAGTSGGGTESDKTEATTETQGSLSDNISALQNAGLAAAGVTQGTTTAGNTSGTAGPSQSGTAGGTGGTIGGGSTTVGGAGTQIQTPMSPTQ